MKHSYPAVVAAILAVIFCADVIIAAQIDLPRVEPMPNEPAPYVMRDWLDVTQGYVDYALDAESRHSRMWIPAFAGMAAHKVNVDGILALKVI